MDTLCVGVVIVLTVIGVLEIAIGIIEAISGKEM